MLNKYNRKIRSEIVDVYDILQAYEISNHAVAHAVKKLLMPGDRGYKNIIQDLEEAKFSIKRAIEIENDKAESDREFVKKMGEVIPFEMEDEDDTSST